MKEIVIPKTELKVSALCLGGGPHGVDPEESEKVLDYYLASGGNFIDTANIYGQWKPGGGVSVSERFLGKYIKSRKCRNRIVLDTKGAAPHFDTMHVPRVSRKDILHDIDDSLKNLQVDYVDLYLAYTDSIKKQTDTETIRKMQSLYNYQLREKENQKLKDINAKQEAKVIGLIFILILSITSFLLYSQYTKRKREQKKEQQRRLQEIKERQYQKSIEFIEKNAKHIHFLETQLQVAQSEKDELKQELLEAQKELIENTNKQIEAEQKEQTLLESNLKRSDIYIHFHQAAKNQTNITAAEWNDLQAMIDQTYGMFTKRLYALFPQISEQELRICLLLKISISATGIANLTLRSKQAVTSSRKKLYEKTHGQQGGPEKWDQFIQAF